MNTAIRVLLVVGVGMFTSDFRRAVNPSRRMRGYVAGLDISGSLDSKVVSLQVPGVE
jgi:hypothetical protein